MRLALLSDIDNPHTIKWAIGLAQSGVEVLLFGLTQYETHAYENIANLTVISADLPKRLRRTGQGAWVKWRYITALPKLRRALRQFQPDCIHAHYLTSYGLLARLCGRSPKILSVWGADIFDFPKLSWLHRWYVSWILRGMQHVQSTSHIMAREAQQYTQHNIEVIPFGIDCQQFAPRSAQSIRPMVEVVIGTIKTMTEKYGIRYLIQAFARVVEQLPERTLHLLLVGSGEQLSTYKRLAEACGVIEHVTFTDAVPYNEVSKYHNALDIAVFPSILDSESFGVSVLEASACGKPVVVSDVGGLPEVVEAGITGIQVPTQDVTALTEALLQLITHPEKAKQMGLAGRQFVKQHYAWQQCLQKQLQCYQQYLEPAI